MHYVQSTLFSLPLLLHDVFFSSFFFVPLSPSRFFLPECVRVWHFSVGCSCMRARALARSCLCVLAMQTQRFAFFFHSCTQHTARVGRLIFFPFRFCARWWLASVAFIRTPKYECLSKRWSGSAMACVQVAWKRKISSSASSKNYCHKTYTYKIASQPTFLSILSLSKQLKTIPLLLAMLLFFFVFTPAIFPTFCRSYS